MIKTGYLGKYQGVPIYTISFKEFYELPKTERDTTEVIYMIQEDRQVITGGKVFGNITLDGKRLNPYANKVEWRIPYATSITKIRKNEMKIQNEVEVVEAKTEMKIERPTTESLVKETEKKLVEVKHVAENKVEDLHHEAETKLAEVVEESGDAVQMVLETATEAATDMAKESKKVLNAVAEEGAVKAEVVTAKSTTTTRRKKKTVTPVV